MLPVPDLEPKKRRGGKRYRKMKEKYGLTDVQKAANRVQFNQAEEEFLDGEEVVGLGMVGKQGTGNLRKLQVWYSGLHDKQLESLDFVKGHPCRSDQCHHGVSNIKFLTGMTCLIKLRGRQSSWVHCGAHLCALNQTIH